MSATTTTPDLPPQPEHRPTTSGASAATEPDRGKSARGRLTGADGLRAAAALWVLLSHAYQRLNAAGLPDWLLDIKLVMMKGSYGVSIFFVLSGMLLAFPFWNAYLRGEPLPSLTYYAKRRFARIAPGYWASLLVSFVVGLYLFTDVPYAVARFVAGFTFTSGLSWVTLFPVEANGPLWSISFEVISYVLLPLMMVALFVVGRRWRRSPWNAVAAWVVTMALIVAVNQWLVASLDSDDAWKGWDKGNIGGAALWWPDYNPIALFAHFLCGIGAACAIAMYRHRRGDVRAWWWDLVALGGLAWAAWLTWSHREPAEPINWDNFQGQPYLWPWFAVAIAVALVGLAHSRFLHRIVDNRAARYTATVSFGLYIWHYLILHLMEYITAGQYVYDGILNPAMHTWMTVGVLLMSYAVAAFSWRVIERPVLRSRWATRRSVEGR